MALANILSEMPDLLERTLSEHTPDAQGFCRECRDATGVSAIWPCVTRELAEQARSMNGDPTGAAPVEAPPDAAPVEAPLDAAPLDGDAMDAGALDGAAVDGPASGTVAGRRRARDLGVTGAADGPGRHSR